MFMFMLRKKHVTKYNDVATDVFFDNYTGNTC